MTNDDLNKAEEYLRKTCPICGNQMACGTERTKLLFSQRIKWNNRLWPFLVETLNCDYQQKVIFPCNICYRNIIDELITSIKPPGV